MRTVENPKELFRKFDATNMDDGDTYSFQVNSDGAHREMTADIKDMSDPFTDFTASLEAIEDAATEVDNADEVPASTDAQFVTSEDGEQVVYMADTDRLGYEVIERFSEPRLAAYVVADPDRIVKVNLAG